MSSPSEARIVTAILARLNAMDNDNPVYFWRANTGAGRVGKGSKSRFVAFGIAGTADILGCVAGKFVAIEVKSSTGLLSPEQLAWWEKIRKAGGEYTVMREVIAADKWVRQILRQALTHPPTQ